MTATGGSRRRPAGRCRLYGVAVAVWFAVVVMLPAQITACTGQRRTDTRRTTR